MTSAHIDGPENLDLPIVLQVSAILERYSLTADTLRS